MTLKKIVFWISTGIIFLFEGIFSVLVFLFFDDASQEGMSDLGYPEYFYSILTVCKVLGAIALIVPVIPRRVKEWAYAGFMFNFIFASLSHWAVEGFSFSVVFPLLFFGVLVVSYRNSSLV